MTTEQHIQAGLDFIKERIIAEIKAQGHVASGKFINEIDTIVREQGAEWVGQLMVLQYGSALDTGISPERIPYTRGSGRGGTNKYIEALMEWIRDNLSSRSDREVKSFAYAIAESAKQREGHPLKGSYAYSQNGRRTEWSRYAIDNNLAEFETIMDLETLMVESIETLITTRQ